MNKLVKVRSDSAPPCNQSTLDKEVPYCTFAVPKHNQHIYCQHICYCYNIMHHKIRKLLEKLPYIPAGTVLQHRSFIPEPSRESKGR
ncbi:hypothetical protein LINGRAHAP2_LOCUS25466 [Linum grandiflorum]